MSDIPNKLLNQSVFSSATQEVTFEPGRLLGGKYKVIAALGKGGMGTVYRVQQLFLKKDFALKTMSSHAISDVAVQRFQMEAKAASRLNHPNLVHVSDFGLLEDGAPYLVMDFVDGVTFAQHLKTNGPLSPELAAAYFSPACFGLLAAHEEGVVHRDIKPGNLMIDSSLPLGSDGSIKVVDFGIAKHRQSGEIQELTRTGEIFGSPLYMSPEQCIGGVVDHRSDIYSLGCVLFEMLSGTPPHMGQNMLSTMMLHESGKVPSLREASLGKEFQPAIEQIVSKMLQKLPADRYQNMGLVAHDLAAACRGAGITIEPPKPITKAKPPKPASTISTGRLIAIVSSVAILSGAVSGLVGYKLGQRRALSKLPSPIQPAIADSKDPTTLVSVNRPASDTTSTKSKDGDEPVSDASDKDDSLRNSGDIVGVVDKAKNTRTYIFPKRPIGELIGYHLESPSTRGNRFCIAQNTVTVPANRDITLVVEGPDYLLDARNPFILNRIRGNEFRGVIASSAMLKMAGIADDANGTSEPIRETSLAIGILQNLTGWTNLDSLCFKEFKLNAAGFAILDQIKKLKRMTLDGCTFDPIFLANMKLLRNLNYLAINHPQKSADCILKALAGSTELQNFRISYGQNQISSAAVQSLESCPNLSILSLCFEGAAVDDSMIEAIGHLRKLKTLYLEECVLSDKQLRMLAGFSNLDSISLNQRMYPFNKRKHVEDIIRHVRFI